MSNLRNFNITNLNLDAFARLRMSEPKTIFDSKQLYDSQPLFWDDREVSGSGTSSTFVANKAKTTISVGNLTVGKRVRQTFRHFNYQPGKSQMFIETFKLGTKTTGITRRVGMFNDKNGLFLKQDATELSVNIRSFVTGVAVDRSIPQADWNIDKLDGTGSSRITLDDTKDQIFFCDFEWLGVGTVAYGFFIDRKPIYVHFEHNANDIEEVYMSTPNLPLRYEIENDGTGLAASLDHICSTVITEGGREETGYPRTLNRGTNTLTTLNDANIYPLIAIRLKSTHLGALVKLLKFTINCTSSATYAYFLKVNPTFVGTSPTWVSLANSSIEYAYPTNTTTVTGGVDLESDITTENNTVQSGGRGVLDSDFALGSNIAETPDVLAICVQRLSGTTETFYSCFNFNETV